MIAVVSGGRSDYGILRPLIAKLDDAVVVACGSHVAYEMGNTIDNVRADGFRVEPVEMLLSADTDSGIGKSGALGELLMVDVFSRLDPEIVVVLGDRFEALSATRAAYETNKTICHLHGGETTLGSRDDSRRHAITCLSDIHLVSTDKAAEKVRSFGKNDVHVIGAIGAYNARHAKPRTYSGPPYRRLGNWKQWPSIIVSVPSDTSVAENVDEAIRLMDGAGWFIHRLGPNADAGRKKMTGDVEQMPPDEFLALLKTAHVIVGNSSCGIIEAPSAKTWTVNVGNRQDGRERCDSIIDVDNDASAIKDALTYVQYRECPDVVNPYEHGDSATHAAEIINGRAEAVRCVR